MILRPARSSGPRTSAICSPATFTSDAKRTTRSTPGRSTASSTPTARGSTPCLDPISAISTCRTCATSYSATRPVSGPTAIQTSSRAPAWKSKWPKWFRKRGPISPSQSAARPRLRSVCAARLLCCLVAAIAGCAKPAARGPSLTVALALFPEEARRYRQFAGDFERRSHIHLSLVAQSYVDILHALEAEAGAGRGALDLVELDLAMLGEARPHVLPVDELVTASGRSLFPQAAWQAATTDWQIFFIPHRLMWQAMIYNRIEVPAPPATWQELSAFVEAHPGKLALKGALYEGAICDVMPFVWAAGGSEQAPDAPGSMAALDFL